MGITFNTSAKPGETAYKDILFEVKDQVAWITINRPRVRNAFREQTLDEMIHAFSSTRLDPMIACAVVTGAGDEAFSAGGDFHAMMKLNRANAHMWNDRMLGLAMTIRGLPIPVIAMVNGWCMGGGHELALWCDLVIASENAVFGQTGAKVAACPTVGATQYLPRIIGERLAREMIFMARTFPAAEAVQVGLINRCVPKADLLKETLAWCEKAKGHSGADAARHQEVAQLRVGRALRLLAARHGAARQYLGHGGEPRGHAGLPRPPQARLQQVPPPQQGSARPLSRRLRRRPQPGDAAGGRVAPERSDAMIEP